MPVKLYKKLSLIVIIIYIFSFRICYSGLYDSQYNLFNPGINIGIGLPKIPISHYRTPVSVCGGMVIYIGIASRFTFNVSGNALYTFNLGSVLEGKSTLKFNMIWGNVCLDYKLKESLHSESYISPGIGYYNLYQMFDDDINKVNTAGFTVGVITNRIGKKTISQFEVRWHLLFKPEPNPQVLTVKFGFVF